MKAKTKLVACSKVKTNMPYIMRDRKLQLADLILRQEGKTDSFKMENGLKDSPCKC